MLTGYWPPTNEAVRHFSVDPAKNPGGWQGANWEGRGYDVHSYFPEFSPPNCTSCGQGTGQLEVDYQDTTTDFWALANALEPMAVITFSRGSGGVSWELEMNQYNRSVWINDFTPPFQPNQIPPDPSVPAGHLRLSKLPVQNIVNSILANNIPVNPFICVTADGGGYLSEYIAYLGVWYQSVHQWPDDPAWCVAAGHVHVGSAVSWALARQAAEETLRQVILHTDAVRAATTCQTDIGSQGPGAATLSVCGGPLNVFGNVADVRVADATASSVGLLALGAQNNPTPLFGGTLIPNPAFYVMPVLLDAQGSWLGEGFLQAPPTPLSDVFAQVAWFDPTLPSSWGLTNALQITLQ